MQGRGQLPVLWAVALFSMQGFSNQRSASGNELQIFFLEISSQLSQPMKDVIAKLEDEEVCKYHKGHAAVSNYKRASGKQKMNGNGISMGNGIRNGKWNGNAKHGNICILILSVR